MRTLNHSALIAALLIPSLAFAAGLEVPENGSLMLARGGTAAGVNGTAYGVEFNPASLADIANLDVRVDLRLVNNQVSFTRQPYQNPLTELTTTFAPVSNSAGIFAAPGVYAGYHPKGLPIAIGVGVFGPPGVGAYQYPDPRNLVKNPNVSYAQADAESGQRYSLISSNATILLPTLSLAWKVLDQVSLGVSVSEASAHVTNVQAVAAGSNGGNETVDSDGYATIDVRGLSNIPIFGFGVMMTLWPGLTLGAQYRIGYILNMNGTISVTGLTPDVSLTQHSPTATSSAQTSSPVGLSMNQPPETRFGMSYDKGYRWSWAIDGVLEDWSAFNNLTLNGQSVYITSGTGTQNLGQQTISKAWVDAWSARLGGSYRIIMESDNKYGIGLQVHLGGLYESNAIPAATQGIDEVTGDRWGGSCGVTASWHGLGLTWAMMGYLPQTLNVTNSTVDRTVSGVNNTSPPDPTPVIIGNGVYNVNLWVMSIGLSYSG